MPLSPPEDTGKMVKNVKMESEGEHQFAAFQANLAALPPRVGRRPLIHPVDMDHNEVMKVSEKKIRFTLN
jgi:hypothetical protein